MKNISQPKQDQADSIKFRIECARDTDRLTLWMNDGSIRRNVSKADALALDPMTVGQVGY